MTLQLLLNIESRLKSVQITLEEISKEVCDSVHTLMSEGGLKPEPTSDSVLGASASTLIGASAQNEQSRPTDAELQRMIRMLVADDDSLTFDMYPQIVSWLKVPGWTRVPVCWGNRINDDPNLGLPFLAEVYATRYALGIPSNLLIACMYFESGLRADAKNPNSTATGLIQFMEATAKGMGTTTAMLKTMTPTQQMAYVRRYFKPYKQHFKLDMNLEDLYMAILYPKAIAEPLTAPIFLSGSAAYRVNRALDEDHDGLITKAECGRKVRKVFETGLSADNMCYAYVNPAVM